MAFKAFAPILAAIFAPVLTAALLATLAAAPAAFAPPLLLSNFKGFNFESAPPILDIPGNFGSFKFLNKLVRLGNLILLNILVRLGNLILLNILFRLGNLILLNMLCSFGSLRFLNMFPNFIFLNGLSTLPNLGNLFNNLLKPGILSPSVIFTNIGKKRLAPLFINPNPLPNIPRPLNPIVKAPPVRTPAPKSLPKIPPLESKPPSPPLKDSKNVSTTRLPKFFIDSLAAGISCLNVSFTPAIMPSVLKVSIILPKSISIIGWIAFFTDLRNSRAPCWKDSNILFILSEREATFLNVLSCN